MLSPVKIKEYVKVSVVGGHTVNRRYFELFAQKRQGIYARKRREKLRSWMEFRSSYDSALLAN
jgi:hypothetical protein